jgi:hypothetical protein
MARAVPDAGPAKPRLPRSAAGGAADATCWPAQPRRRGGRKARPFPSANPLSLAARRNAAAEGFRRPDAGVGCPGDAVDSLVRLGDGSPGLRHPADVDHRSAVHPPSAHNPAADQSRLRPAADVVTMHQVPDRGRDPMAGDPSRSACFHGVVSFQRTITGIPTTAQGVPPQGSTATGPASQGSHRCPAAPRRWCSFVQPTRLGGERFFQDRGCHTKCPNHGPLIVMAGPRTGHSLSRLVSDRYPPASPRSHACSRTDLGQSLRRRPAD